MAKIEIPIVEIQPVGEIFKPSSEDVQSGINNQLNKRLKEPNLGLHPNEICGSSNHRLVLLNPTSPHTTGDHMVFWIDANPKGTKTITSWEKNSWQELVKDQEFLNKVQKYFQNLQKENPVIKVYMYLGFVRPSGDFVNKEGFAIPLQSQIRPHIHASELVNTWNKNSISSNLNLEDKEGLRQLSFLLNLAGERTIKDYSQELENYGDRFVYEQKIGIGKITKTIKRTLFGFNSLEEAIRGSIELQRRVFPTWEPYINNLKNKEAEFAGYKFPLLQSYVPNIAIIIPSEMDRKNGQVKNNFPVWAMPFGTVGAQILVPGGVITKRATPYEVK